MQVSCQDIACSPTADALLLQTLKAIQLKTVFHKPANTMYPLHFPVVLIRDYNVSVNNGDPVVTGFEGTVVVGPVPALQTANIAVEGVDNNLCTATASVDATVCPPDNDDACNALFVPADGSQEYTRLSLPLCKRENHFQERVQTDLVVNLPMDGVLSS